MRRFVRFFAWVGVFCALVSVLTVPAFAAEKGVMPKYRQVYQTVPNFYQTDYAHIRYGKGNMATSGCSITCLAMVASYLTDSCYDPGELGLYYDWSWYTIAHRMLMAADDIGITYQPKTNDFRKVVEALQNEQPVILLVNDNSYFGTEYGHYLVLTGLTEEGKILVNDPYEPNYSKTHLKDGFENGFTEEQVTLGFVSAWIFQKKEVPAVHTVVSQKGHFDILLCCK